VVREIYDIVGLRPGSPIGLQDLICSSQGPTVVAMLTDANRYCCHTLHATYSALHTIRILSLFLTCTLLMLTLARHRRRLAQLLVLRQSRESSTEPGELGTACHDTSDVVSMAFLLAFCDCMSHYR
jgi:hypothetical protein